MFWPLIAPLCLRGKVVNVRDARYTHDREAIDNVSDTAWLSSGQYQHRSFVSLALTS
jgi:hypothetical protein